MALRSLFLLFIFLLAARAETKAQAMPTLVKDFGMLPGSTAGMRSATLNGKFVTDSLGTLMISDGTDTGTHSVKVFYNISAMLVVNNKLFMIACDTLTHGSELWISDGTETGTHLVKEINSTPNASGVMYFNYSDYSLAAFGTEAYFYGNDGTGVELWKSDGTNAGTTPVAGINTTPGADILDLSAFPFGAIKATSNKFFFSVNDGINGAELWVTDGTTANTHIVKDLIPGAAGSDPQYLTALGNKLCFWAYGVTDSGLYITDGTDTGTHLLARHIYTPNSEQAVIGNKLYFFADTIGATGTSALWVTDGTVAGTHWLSHAYYITTERSLQSQLNSFLTPYHNKLFFGAAENLWTSDTSTGSSYLLKDLVTIADMCCTPTHIVSFGGKLYMRARGFSDRMEILVSDGTDTGTHMLPFPGANFTPSTAAAHGNYIFQPLTVVGNKLFFWNAYTNASGHALYKIDLDVLETTNLNNDQSVILYPNPTNDWLHISLPQNTRIYNIDVFSIDGRLIKSAPGSNSGNLSLNLIDCPTNQLLVIKIHTSNGTIIRKLEHRQ